MIPPPVLHWLLGPNFTRYAAAWSAGILVFGWLERRQAAAMSSWELVEHLVYWLLGLVVIYVAHRRVVANLREKDAMLAQLARSEQRWQTAIESAGDGLWEWDAATDETYYSPRWKAMIGYRDEEFPSRHSEWLAHLHPEDRERVEAAIRAHMEGTTPRYECEHRLRCKDGTYRWVLSRGQVIARTTDGRPLRAVGTHTDVMARHHLEEQLRASRERYRFFLEHATEPMIAYFLPEDGAPSCFIEVNVAACRLSGYTREQMLTMSLLELEKNRPAGESEKRRDFLRRKQPLRFESEMIAADGRVVPVEMNGQLFDFEGRAIVLATVRDISAARREQARQRKETEQAKLLQELYARAPEMTEQQIFDQVVETAVSLTDSEVGFLHRIGGDEDTVVVTTWNKKALEIGTIPYRAQYPLRAAGNWSDCVREKRPVIYNDFAHSPNQRGLPEGHLAIKRLMSVPVIEAGKVQIIFGVANKAQDYGDEDVARVQLIAAELQKIISRLRTELALREREAWFRVLFEESGDHAYVLEPREAGAPLIIDANAAACRQHGYTREELLGQPITILEVPGSDSVSAERGGRLDRGQREVFEVMHRRKDGSIFPVEVYAKRLERAGRPPVVMSVERDITLRRQAAEEIARLAREREVVLQTLPLGVCLLRDRKVQWANRTLAENLGYTVAELAGMDTAALYASAEGHRRVGEEGYPVIARGEVFEIEVEFLRRDGSRVWGHMNGRALNPANPAEGSIWAVLDLTARRRAENALLTSEMQLASILASTGDGVLAVEKEGRVLRSNRRFAEIWQIPAELLAAGVDEPILAHVLGQLHEPEMLLKHVREIGGTEAESSDEVVTKDGRVIEIDSAPLRMDGGVGGRVWSFRDVSVRVLAEKERRDSEARFASTLGALNDLVFVVDLEGRFVECHRPPSYPLLLPAEQFIGRDYASVLPVPVADQLRESLRALAISGEAQTFDYELAVEGRPGWWTATVSIRRDGYGRRNGSVLVIRDVSDRKRGEQALRESEEKFYQAFHHAPVLIVVTDFATGRVLQANAKAEEVSGFMVSDGIGRTAVDLGWISPQVRAEFFVQLTATGSVKDFELTGRRKDGGEVHCVLNCQLVTIDGQQRVISILQDVTDRKRAEQALRDEKQRFRSLFDHAPFGIFEEDFSGVQARFAELRRDGVVDFGAHLDAHPEEVQALAGRVKILLINQRSVDVFGVASVEALRGSLARNVSPEAWPVLRDEFVALAQGRTQFTGEIAAIDAGGGKRFLDITVTVQPGHEATLDRVVVTFADITERRRAEGARKESEERYRKLVELSPEAIIVQVGGAVVFANRAAAVLMGAERAEAVLGRKLLDFVHPDSQALVKERIRRMALGEPMQLVEQKWLRFDGSVIHVASVASGLELGGKQAFLVIALDVTARHQAEAELRESRENYRGLFDTVTEAIYVHDEHGVFLDVNAGATRLYGYTREELIGQTPAHVAAPDRNDLAAVGAQSARIFATGVAESFEFWGRRKNGEVFPKACITHKGKYFGRDVLITTARDMTVVKQAEAELRKLARAVEQSPVTVVITDTKGVIEYANPQFTKASGYTIEEVKGRTPRVLKSGLQPDAVYREMWATIAQGREWRGELCNRRKDGSFFWEEVSISPVVDELGRTTHFLAVKEDISERRRTLAALRESEVRFRSLAESLPNIAVQGYDRERRVVFWNSASAELYGYSREEALGCRLEDLIVPPESRAGFVAAVDQWAGGGGVIPAGEVVLQKKDGTPVTVFSSYVMLRQSSGELEMHCIHIDLTARKAAEAHIREQAALINATRDAFIVITLEGAVRFWNAGATLLYGWTAEEALGRLLFELVYDAKHEPPRLARQTILKVGSWSGEIKQRTKAGATLVVQAHGLLLRDPEGAPTSILLTGSDITEAKQLQAQFLRAQRLESVGALASGVAHDLNNVLSPIMMSVELLRPLAVTEPDREVLRLMSDSVRRGADVVRQLLLFGRGADTPSDTMDVAKVMKEIVRMIRETFPRNLTITSQAPRDLWAIRGHPTEIYQVMLNFCVNARDAMPHGGTLTLDAFNLHFDEESARKNPGARPGRYVVVRVSDTGTGIPPEVIDRIFDPFFTTKEQGKGTGLGLSTVVGIAKSHGGFVTVTSRMGEGSEFRVYLPASDGEGRSAAENDPTTLWHGHGELILLVDDEAAIRHVLERALTQKGYRVVTAKNGNEAIPLCEQHRTEVAVAVLDMMMPGLDGPLVLKALRGIAPALAVVACSGQHSYAATIKQMGLPNVRFMPKPVEIPALLETLRSLLDARSDSTRPPAPFPL